MIESRYLEENQTVLKTLKNIPTLQPFEDDDLRRLVGLSKIRKYTSGELVFEEGSYDSYLYFLIYGKVDVVKDGKNVAEFKRRGDIFGEMGAMDGAARSASVIASAETVCLATDTTYINRLAGRDKMAFCYMLYRVFAEVLAVRLRSTTRILIQSNKKFYQS